MTALIEAPLHEGEEARVEAVLAYGVLDTPPEEAFDRITIPLCVKRLLQTVRRRVRSSRS